MTNTRDWITVAEHAKSEGVTREAIYNRISRGTFHLPYIRMEGPKGMFLIHNPNAEPQKTKAQPKEALPETAFDCAQNR